jgi:hypothetical protein
MRKLSSLLVAALVATVAFGVLAATAAEKTKVKTKVTIKYNAGTGAPYYENASFSGKVKAKKGCKKNRKVKVKEEGGQTVGKDRSNNNGRYEVAAGSFNEGDFFAKVKKKKLEKKGKTIVCKKARSKTISVP